MFETLEVNFSILNLLLPLCRCSEALDDARCEAGGFHGVEALDCQASRGCHTVDLVGEAGGAPVACRVALLYTQSTKFWLFLFFCSEIMSNFDV